jgi:hypothetical protein
VPRGRRGCRVERRGGVGQISAARSRQRPWPAGGGAACTAHKALDGFGVEHALGRAAGRCGAVRRWVDTSGASRWGRDAWFRSRCPIVESSPGLDPLRKRLGGRGVVGMHQWRQPQHWQRPSRAATGSSSSSGAAPLLGEPPSQPRTRGCALRRRPSGVAAASGALSAVFSAHQCGWPVRHRPPPRPVAIHVGPQEHEVTHALGHILLLAPGAGPASAVHHSLSKRGCLRFINGRWRPFLYVVRGGKAPGTGLRPAGPGGRCRGRAALLPLALVSCGQQCSFDVLAAAGAG